MKAKNTSKTNVKRDLLLLISVPLALAGLLAAVVYIPQSMANPTQDFVYQSCASYWCDENYKVRNGSIVPPVEDNTNEEESDDIYPDRGELELYVYDVSEDSSRPISEEEALKLSVDASTRSNEGYELVKESESGGLMFGNGESSWVLQDGLFRKRVSLVEARPYSDSIKFIGWVE